MYYFPQPPYLLLVFALFIGMTSGAAFEATLKQKVQAWSDNPEENELVQAQGVDLFIPFLGICAGICAFLAGGLEIFSFSRGLSYVIALPLTVFIGRLVWSQLGVVLLQLQEGGSQAIDLDIYR